ncbi:TadE family type IV pilus minor pilin [Actinokineospora guangxiensis]|uniref:TadE family type IV pilus minor pilin n=1 Tax=Actinokineospora guangxiensis TaxID=1490288 RepID=A0ABW0EH92_9PSEU
MIRTDDRGAVTVEAAIAVVAMVVALGLVLAGAAAAIDHIRCVDAAREAARLAARGDPDRAHRAAAELAPAGATVSITYADDTVRVHVLAGGPLPGLRLSADAHSMLEPGVGEPGAAEGGGSGAPP